MWRRILRQQPSRNHLFIYIVPATPYFASFSFPFSPDISGSRDWPWYGPPVWKRRRRCSEQTCAARRPHPTSPATWPRPPRAPMILSYRISTGWRRHRPTTVERCGANDRQSAGRGPLAWHTGSRIEEIQDRRGGKRLGHLHRYNLGCDGARSGQRRRWLLRPTYGSLVAWRQ